MSSLRLWALRKKTLENVIRLRCDSAWVKGEVGRSIGGYP